MEWKLQNSISLCLFEKFLGADSFILLLRQGLVCEQQHPLFKPCSLPSGDVTPPSSAASVGKGTQLPIFLFFIFFGLLCYKPA